jgi:hypothetical protein
VTTFFEGYDRPLSIRAFGYRRAAMVPTALSPEAAHFANLFIGSGLFDYQGLCRAKSRHWASRSSLRLKLYRRPHKLLRVAKVSGSEISLPSPHATVQAHDAIRQLSRQFPRKLIPTSSGGRFRLASLDATATSTSTKRAFARGANP